MDVIIYNRKYSIDDDLVKILKDNNVEINETYYDYLNQYKNPYHSLDEVFVRYAACDALTRLLINKYGDIVCVNGSDIGRYNNFVDAILNNFTTKATFYFFNRMENAFSDYNFFNINVKIANDKLTRNLNLFVQKIISNNTESKNKKYYNDEYFKEKLNGISYEDFVLQRRRNQAFLLGLELAPNKNGFPKDRSNIDKEGYMNVLHSIINRYSYEGESAFVKVENLNECDEYLGIYLLCLEGELGFYVGQTTTSFKRRILQHLNGIETYFDCHHRACDITDIYIMHTDGRFVDDIESDLIAFIPSNYSLNIVAGGKYNNVFVYRDSYKPNNYLLKDKQVMFRTKESLKIRKREEYFYFMDKESDECTSVAKKFIVMSDKEKTYDICLKSVYYKGDLIEKVPQEFRDEKLCWLALNSFESIDLDKVISNIPSDILTHEFALKIVEKIHSAYYSLPKELQTREMQLATGYKRFKK